MKDKLIQIRVDAEFLSKLEYLQKINGFKSTAEILRKTVEKEWRKEKTCCNGCAYKSDSVPVELRCRRCSRFYADGYISESDITVR